MGTLKFSNNASTTLSGSINDTQTSITVASATSFPVVASPDYFYATIYELAGNVELNIEIVKVTNTTGAVWTIVRGQDGTLARARNGVTTCYVELRMVAASATLMLQSDNNLSDLASVATAKTNLGLNNVENTAISTWTGSANIATVGSVLTGNVKNLNGGNNTTLLGSIPYQSNTNTTTLLAPNTTTTKKFMRQTGSGTNGAAPAWDTVLAADVGLGNVTNESKATMFTSPTFTGLSKVSTTAAVTAGTNAQGQGALTSEVNVVTVTSANPSGVTLPTAVAGTAIVVVNAGTNPVNVFPASSAIIDANAANASVSLPVGGAIEFFASSATQWYSTLKSSIAASSLAGTVAVANGGTGAATITGLVKGNGTSAMTAAVAGTDYMAPASTITLGTSNFALNRASGAQTLQGVSIDGDAGTVAGKSFGAFTAAGGILYASTTTAASGTGAGTAGQALLSAGGSAPVWTTLTLENLPDAAVKRSVRAATTANITLSGTQTIDGIVLVANDRVLVKDQTTTSANGIYVVAAGAWTRSTDADTASKIAGAFVNVDSGTTNGGLLFDTDFKTTDTLGTTAMTWARSLDTSMASSTTPAALAAAGAVGTSLTYARSDHVHAFPTAANVGAEPAFTTLPVSKGGTGAGTLTGLVKGTGTTAMVAAVAGTDYLAPAAIGTTVQAYSAELTNKTFNDSTFFLQDETDNTKKAQFQLSGLTTATTYTYTLPALTGTLATTGALTQTFSGTTTFSGAVTLSNAVTLSSTTGALSIGTSATTGTVTVGSAAGTGILTFGQSTGAQTINVATGATATATTKTVNIGTAGVSGSTTAISIGSAVSGSKSNVFIQGGLVEFKVAMAANAIDLGAGNFFTKTISALTTFTVSNVPATGKAASFILELTNGGAFAVTWFAGVKWAGGVAPTLTAAGVDILGFYTHDGGTTWRGLVLAKDSK